MKKLLLLLFVFVGLINVVRAQNAIVGTGFSSGWGSDCTTPTAANYTNFVASAGTTYTSNDLTPNGTGNQYWRLAINWSSTYFQISNGSDMAITPGVKTNATVTCTATGAYYRNVSALTNRYVFKTLNAGVSPTGTWVFFELGGASATVSSVSLSPATPTVNNAGTVTATLSGALPTGQAVYLRYTTDNWATSSVSTMTGSGTSYTAYIGTQALNTVVKYYVFTSGSGLTIAPADADLYTINWNAGSLNGGSNYSYTVAAGATLSQSLLFDFGPGEGTNGDTIAVADANGKYWNNIFNTAVAATKSLRNSSGAAQTGYSLAITASGFITNGKLNGGLRTPYASQFTAGGSDTDLAIGTATEDFFYAASGTSPAFKITGLNPNKKYIFKIFGTRNGSLARNAQYSIVGAATTVGNLDNSRIPAYNTVYSPTAGNGYTSDGNNSYQLTSSGIYTVATPYYGNNMYTYNTDYLTPLNVSGSGQFTLTMSSPLYAQNCFINCMKLEEYKATQTITFGALSTKTVGDADYAPGATASSGLTVTYSSSNTSVASIISGKIHVIAAGSTIITASQVGDGTYDAATNVTQSLTVSAGALTAQTITFGALSAKNVGDAAFGLTATASSSLTVSYSSSNTAVATVSGSTVTIVGAGTTDITASQAGNSTYAAAPNVIQTLTVNKLNQTITFGSLSAKTDADAPFTVTTPTSTSGLAVALTSSNTNVALISGYTITIVGAGTSTITASQAGDATYNAATSVPQTLTVSSTLSVNQSLFFDFGVRDVTNGDETVNPDANGNYWNNISTATGSSALGIATPAYTSLINSSNTNSGFSLAFTADGFTTNGKANGGLLSPYASQFGSNSELAIATATEDYIYTGATTNGPVIRFSNLNASKKYKFKIFGCRNMNADRAAQYTLQGAGAATVGTLQSSTATGLGGTVYIDAATSYPGNLNVSYTLTSSGSNTQAVTYYGNNSTVYTSGLIEPDASGYISLTTITTTPSSAFAYINALKIEEYATAQTITFGALSAKSYGDADYSAGATASSGLTVSLSSSNTAVATIVSGQIHIVGPGSTTITASQAGNSTYSPATSVSQSLTVNKASSSITATGTTSFAYNHSAQGPASASESGSTGAITYSYSGTGGTTYAASTTKPTNVGTYQVIATVAADANYNTASSTPFAFSITAVSTIAPVSIISNPLGTYALDQSVTWTFDLTGSAFAAGEDLYLWIWSPSEPDAGNWSNSSSFAKLTYVNGMVWSMTLTPTTYFSKTVSEIQASAGFWMLLKDKSGNIQTADFSVSQTINRQVISITDNQTSTALTNIFADIDVSATGSLTLDASKTIHDITIERGGKVTNNNGVTLTANNLTINSDVSGTGTYVDNGTTTVSGVANVQQYLSSARNWYISSPVSGAKAKSGYTFYRRDEANNNWVTMTTGDGITSGDALNIGQGYIANLASGSGTYTFSGPLNTGSASITVYRTAAQATKPGFNLVGNPYPSYLNARTLVNSTANLEKSIWYRTQKKNTTTYFFDTYNTAGNLGTNNSQNNNFVIGTVAPMQAFWVRVSQGQTSATLNFYNSYRTHATDTVNVMKSKALIDQPVLRLQVSNGTNSDEAIVYFNPNASNGYDNFDSPKMSNSSVSVPEIYLTAGGEQLAIDGLNSIQYDTELPLGFTTTNTQNSLFSLKVSQFSSFDSSTQVYLKDYQSADPTQLINLTDGTNYTFNSDAVNTTGRFALIFKSTSISTGINPDSNTNVWLSLNGNNQVVVNNANAETQIGVYNELGQKLLSQSMKSTIKTLDTQFAPGVYLVTITNAGKTIKKKIIID